MATADPDLTLLVPCFNEGGRIDACLDAARAWAGAHPAIDLEVVCVDDGSSDDTGSRLAAWARDWARVRVVVRTRNGGKGAALRSGMAEARGALVLFLDADLAVDLSHLEPALALFDDGADVVIGCRNIAGAAIRRPQRFLRRFLGRCYLRGSRFLLGLRASDITCGFKGFRREAGGPLFARARARGWGIDAEVLLLAQRAGCAVRELPVQWFHDDVSAVRMHRDVFRSLGELVSLRVRTLFRSAPGRSATPVSPAREVAAGTVRDA